MGQNILKEWCSQLDRQVDCQIFGRVLEICVVDRCISFIMDIMAAFLENLRCYQLSKRDPAVTVVVELDILSDYIPLAAYPIERKLLITRKTFMLH